MSKQTGGNFEKNKVNFKLGARANTAEIKELDTLNAVIGVCIGPWGEDTKKVGKARLEYDAVSGTNKTLTNSRFFP